MKYKIIQKEIQGDIVNTVVEFDYKGQTRTVSVMHFRPKNVNDIENGIVNRISSEISTIDAIELTNTLQLELNVEKDLTVFIPNNEANPFSNFTTEELNQKLSLLSADYNTISQKISEAQAELASNSAEYDLIIEELKNRIV
jgi:uncharacterized surface protein with fasciclin (FAS1) repeats